MSETKSIILAIHFISEILIYKTSYTIYGSAYEIMVLRYTLSHYLTFCITGSLANSEDPDEMPHTAAFHHGLHCLLRLKRTLWKEIQF